MISAPACSRTMGIDFLESLAPISYGDVPSLSPPVDRIMPNEGAVIMSPSESLYFWPNQCCLQLCALVRVGHFLATVLTAIAVGTVGITKAPRVGENSHCGPNVTPLCQKPPRAGVVW